jgi:hypothetical protein
VLGAAGAAAVRAGAAAAIGGSAACSPAGEGRGGSHDGAAGVSQLSTELLAGMQWQMQQLVSQEEQRWLEVTSLRAQVRDG